MIYHSSGTHSKVKGVTKENPCPFRTALTLLTKDLEEAVRYLNVAASAYDDAIYAVPDFPDEEGNGPPIAQTRPHDTGPFHHTNLGMAHLQRAREIAAVILNKIE